MPTSGIGAFSGTAVGTVSDSDATRTAAGAFSQSYNFAALTGTLNIANFDGANYRAAISGSGNAYSGSLIGPPNRSGSASGNSTPMPDCSGPHQKRIGS
jgi:hypothetical protein